MAAKWSWKTLTRLGYFGSGLLCAAVATSVYAKAKENGTNANDKIPHAGTPPENSPHVIKNYGQNQRLSRTSEVYQGKLQDSISKARDLCVRVKDECGLPGLVIGVSVNGETVWDEGFGYADLENRVKMSPNAVLRIASISKSMTMAMMAKLMEEDKIDIDSPIQTYLPNYPKKEVEGKEVVITTRDLLSHLSGIRHYLKKGETEVPGMEMSLREYYLKEKFESVEKAIALFQDDELLHEPGVKYHYTTHGWTVVSAIVEQITGVPFPKHAQLMFKYWGLDHTFLDKHEPIIYDRARCYSWDKKDRFVTNSPYVDNSYKWAGGGFVSTVGDLLQFAHIMVASLQNPSGDSCETKKTGILNQPYLKETTMKQIWTGDERTARPNYDFLYGLGFVIGEPMKGCLFCKERKLMTVFHTGAAVGASSVLLMVFPKHFRFGYDETDLSKQSVDDFSGNNVKAVTVAMITNLTDVGLSKTAQEIADLFQWLV